jgi:hypothetical protein
VTRLYSSLTTLHIVYAPLRSHKVQVVEGVSKTFVRYPGEDQSSWLLRLTHLHCQVREALASLSDLGEVSSSYSLLETAHYHHFNA